MTSYFDNKKLHKLNILLGGGFVIFHIADVVNCQVEMLKTASQSWGLKDFLEMFLDLHSGLI